MFLQNQINQLAKHRNNISLTSIITKPYSVVVTIGDKKLSIKSLGWLVLGIEKLNQCCNSLLNPALFK